MEDTTDIFDSGLFALFAVPPIGFSTSSPSDPWMYTPPPALAAAAGTSLVPDKGDSQSPGPAAAPVKLWLPHPPASLYAALQANNLWLSAVYLADRIGRGELFPHGATSAPVLELGAGAGLPTIMLARTGHSVVCTDYDDGVVVGTIRRNFQFNVGGKEVGGSGNVAEDDAEGQAGAVAEAPLGFGRWAVRGHTWGTDTTGLLALAPQLSPSASVSARGTAPATAGGFDLVLADTLWTSAGHTALLASVCSLLRRGGTAHVAAGLHTGRGPVDRFVAAAAGAGLRVVRHPEVRWVPGGGWEPYPEHERAREGEGEVRGVVVYYTLHRDE